MIVDERQPTSRMSRTSFGETGRPPGCPLRNLYAGQEATVRTGHGTTDWFPLGKGVRQGWGGVGEGCQQTSV